MTKDDANQAKPLSLLKVGFHSEKQNNQDSIQKKKTGANEGTQRV